MGDRFALPFETAADAAAGVAEDLKGLAFDPNIQSIGPRESRQAPEVAIAVRLSVLLRTYRGDYHTDSFDAERLAARVRSGDELIWFWGAPAVVQALREALATGVAPRGPLDLGTVTVLSAEEEFGPGHGELCRSGSTDATLGAKAPIMARTLAYLRGTEPELTGRYHSLVLAPRTRTTTPEVRGGEAIRRIHLRYVRSRFWGFAPFYVMQGGALEYTEFRESNASPEAIRDRVVQDEPWTFLRPEDERFARALSRISLGVTPPTQLVAPPRVAVRTGLRYELVLPPPAIAAQNHATARPTAKAGLSLEGAVAELARTRVACRAVQVPLTHADAAGAQSLLIEAGYRLSAVVPPKRHAGNSIPATAIFVRPTRDLPIAPPFYMAEPTSDEDDATVLAHLRQELLGALHDLHDESTTNS